MTPGKRLSRSLPVVYAAALVALAVLFGISGGFPVAVIAITVGIVSIAAYAGVQLGNAIKSGALLRGGEQNDENERTPK